MPCLEGQLLHLWVTLLQNKILCESLDSAFYEKKGFSLKMPDDGEISLPLSKGTEFAIENSHRGRKSWPLLRGSKLPQMSFLGNGFHFPNAQFPRLAA